MRRGALLCRSLIICRGSVSLTRSYSTRPARGWRVKGMVRGFEEPVEMLAQRSTDPDQAARSEFILNDNTTSTMPRTNLAMEPELYPLGMITDDLFAWDTDDALYCYSYRLPNMVKLNHERRKRRALVSDLKNEPLPKEEWTNPTDDVPIMMPYMVEVQNEYDEMSAWRFN
eukprot:TRINITY_DN17147_c0_g1_i1.p1 TRINITY_DN17147_c0_g1~~TRINITY_DN17147_c0_g1_i1.p1  ORF type:complete len:171 (-),score=12.80 TRINITY_DN17147_c0_g1_i1:74-586(-)